MNGNANKKMRRSRFNRLSLDDLGNDVLIEILIRIPLDSVYSLKSISKRWFSLISCPSFTRLHYYMQLTKLHTCRNTLIYNFNQSGEDATAGIVDFGSNSKSKTSPCKLRKLSLSFLPVDDLRLAGSCNGLLLLTLKTPRKFFICNPLTKQWVEIPPKKPQKLSRNTNMVTLDLKGEQIGFMCTTPTDHHNPPQCKVVLFQLYQKAMPNNLISIIRISSFCSVSGKWTEFAPPALQNNVLQWGHSRCNTIACNGMLHGLSKRNMFIYDPYTKPDQLKFINLPTTENNNTNYWKAAFIEGNQGKVRLYRYSHDVVLEAWELQDYNTSNWCIRNTIYLNSVASKLPLLGKEKAVFLSIIAFKEIDENVAYICSPKHVYSLDMKTETVKVMLDLQYSKDEINHAFPFVFPSPTPVPNFATKNYHHWINN